MLENGQKLFSVSHSLGPPFSGVGNIDLPSRRSSYSITVSILEIGRVSSAALRLFDSIGRGGWLLRVA
jgi:hypothetical protein